MTHTLRAKTIDIKVKENDDIKVYTYPEIFGGQTPDLVIIQSCGNRVDTSEPDVGRNSIRSSVSYTTQTGSCMTAQAMDSTAASNAHSETYAYWNLPTPASDDGDGVRSSRGTVQLVTDGIIITNDSVYTTENHILTISILSGTDIRNIGIKKWDNTINDPIDIPNGHYKDRVYVDFNGANLFMGMGFGGAADTENAGFIDSKGIGRCERRALDGNGYLPTSSVYVSQRTAYARYLLPSTNAWNLAGISTGLTSTTTTSFLNAKDTALSPISGSGNNGFNAGSWLMYQLSANTDVFAGFGEPLDTSKATGAEYLRVRISSESALDPNDQGQPYIGGYVLCMDFNDSNDNIGFIASNGENPYSDSAEWVGTDQAGTGNSNTFNGTTRGYANERADYTVGGTDDTTNHWLASTGASTKMNQLPITWGMYNQFQSPQLSESIVATSSFMFDGRYGIDTESNSGEDQMQGAGVGYALRSQAEPDTGSGAPETYKFVRPDYYMNAYVYNNPNWEASGSGELEALSSQITQYRQESPSAGASPIEAGSSLVPVKLAPSGNSSTTGGFATVTWGAGGGITSVMLDGSSAGSYGYTLDKQCYVTVNTNGPVGSPTFSAAYVYPSTVDGVSTSGGRIKINRSIQFNDDGSYTMSNDNANEYAIYDWGPTAITSVLILSASDGTGTGDSTNDGGGLSTDIYYGASPITAVYHGASAVTTINYGAA